MGSFNASCFASKQVIAPSNRCRVVLLQRNHTYQPVELSHGETQYSVYGTTCSTCYPVAFWEPVVGFMEATYDDYGQVILLDTPVTRRRLQSWAVYMYMNALVTHQGENSVHDVPFDFKATLETHYPEFFNKLKEAKSYLAFNRDTSSLRAEDSFFTKMTPVWDATWNVAQERRLFGLDNQYPQPLQYGLLHEASYRHLVAFTNKQVSWDKTSYEMRAFFDRSLAKARESSASLEHAAFWLPERLSSVLNRVGYYEGLSPISSDLFEPVWAIAEQLLKGEISDDDLFLELTPFIEERYVLSALCALDLKFGPVVYAGQDYSNETGKAYAKFVSDVQKQVSREQREMYR